MTTRPCSNVESAALADARREFRRDVSLDGEAELRIQLVDRLRIEIAFRLCGCRSCREGRGGRIQIARLHRQIVGDELLGDGLDLRGRVRIPPKLGKEGRRALMLRVHARTRRSTGTGCCSHANIGPTGAGADSSPCTGSTRADIGANTNIGSDADASGVRSDRHTGVPADADLSAGISWMRDSEDKSKSGDGEGVEEVDLHSVFSCEATQLALREATKRGLSLASE